MISYKLKKILIIISIIFNSVHINASNNSFFVSIKKAFNSLTFKKPSFPINRRWIGVGALLIGSYAAWRYFKKKNSPNRPSSKKINPHNQQPNELKAKTQWTDINTDASKKSTQTTKMPIEYSYEDDLEKTLDEADSQLLDKSKQSHLIEQQLQIDDIVKIIDDEKSIEMAPIDKQMYKKKMEEKGMVPNYSIKKLYLHSIGIIRQIKDNTITIEVRAKNTSGFLKASSYITIAKTHVEKCDLKELLKDQGLQKETQVRIQLESEFLKKQLSPDTLNNNFLYNLLHKYHNNLYDENFDNQQYYIATVNNYNQYTNTMDVTLHFHWREGITPYPLPITINKNKALIIYDPRTNAPVVQ